MVAATNHAEKLGTLCACAISLLQRGTRCKHQTQPVFNALAEFIGEKPFLIEFNRASYPGRFGNRCARCGSFIDDGGTCNCGTDHDNEIPGPYAKRFPAERSLEEQVAALIVQTGKAIEMADKSNWQIRENLLSSLQAFKEGKSTRKTLAA
ncbi:MAG: hypothetical protein WC460_01665 [Patescibacteria group bacterium]